jgi:hypothetical protein
MKSTIVGIAQQETESLGRADPSFWKALDQNSNFLLLPDLYSLNLFNCQLVRRPIVNPGSRRTFMPGDLLGDLEKLPVPKGLHFIYPLLNRGVTAAVGGGDNARISGPTHP